MAVVWLFNPSTNDGRTERREYLGTARQSASGPSYVDNVADLVSDPKGILSRGTYLVDGGFCAFGIPPGIHDARINGEASSLVQAYFAGPHSSTPSTPNLEIDKKAGTPHPEHLFASIRDGSSPVTPSSDSMSLKSPSAFSLPTDVPYTPPQSTFGEPEGFVPGPTPNIFIEDSPDVVLAAAIHNWVRENQTVDNPLDQDSLYRRSEATSSDSTPSTLPVTPCAPANVRYEAQQASQDTPQQFQETAKGPAAASSPSSRQTASVNGTAKRPYACNICAKTYSQPQGVRRHQRETHKASLCTHCHTFEWGRPYRLREHYKRQHPEVDIDSDVALKEATRKRPKARMNPRSLPQQVSFSNPPHDRQSRTQPQPDDPLAPTLPLSAVAELQPLTPTRRVCGDAGYAYGDDVKAESQHLQQKKMGMPPSCGVQYHRHSRGFEVTKDTAFLLSKAIN